MSGLSERVAKAAPWPAIVPGALGLGAVGAALLWFFG